MIKGGAEIGRQLLAATQPQHQMEGRLLLDVVVSQGAPIFQLLASKDQPLLVRRDACRHEAGRCHNLFVKCARHATATGHRECWHRPGTRVHDAKVITRH